MGEAIRDGGHRCSGATTHSARRARSRRSCARRRRPSPWRSDDPGRGHRLRPGGQGLPRAADRRRRRPRSGGDRDERRWPRRRRAPRLPRVRRWWRAPTRSAAGRPGRGGQLEPLARAARPRGGGARAAGGGGQAAGRNAARRRRAWWTPRRGGRAPDRVPEPALRRRLPDAAAAWRGARRRSAVESRFERWAAEASRATGASSATPPRAAGCCSTSART